MTYAEKILTPYEQIIYSTGIHWIRYTSALGFLFFALITLLLPPELRCISTILFILTFFSIIRSFVTTMNSEFVITNKRVIIKTGFIKQNSTEILLNKIEAFNVEQPLLGRMFDYGSLIISGTGGSRTGFHDVINPIEFKNQLQQQIELSVKNINQQVQSNIVTPQQQTTQPVANLPIANNPIG